MFEHPRKQVDRWIGQDAVCLHDGAIDSVWYTFQVVEKGISDNQKNTANQVINNYESHWKEIRQLIGKKTSLQNINNRLLLFVPAFVHNKKYEYMLGYEFRDNESLKSAFFAFNGEKLVWNHIDDY